MHLVFLCTGFRRCIWLLAMFVRIAPCTSCFVSFLLWLTFWSILRWGYPFAATLAEITHCRSLYAAPCLQSTPFSWRILNSIILNLIGRYRQSSEGASGIFNILNVWTPIIAFHVYLNAFPNMIPADCAPTPVATTLQAFQRNSKLWSA